MLRDVAYDQLAPKERAARHREAARWIETMAGERVADHAEILAHHYHEALALLDPAVSPEARADPEDRAGRAFILAGDRAVQLDVSKAETYYVEAMATRSADDPEQTEIQAKMAVTAHLTGHFPQAAELYRRVVEERKAAGREADAAAAQLDLAHVLWNQGRTAESRKILEEAVGTLERHPPGRTL